MTLSEYSLKAEIKQGRETQRVHFGGQKQGQFVTLSEYSLGAETKQGRDIASVASGQKARSWHSASTAWGQKARS